MISALVFIDDKTFDRAFSAASKTNKQKSAALGKIGEEITKGLFKSSREATTASGKADIVDIPIQNIKNVLAQIEGKNSPVITSLNAMIRESMGVDAISIEAKATAGFLGGYRGSQRGTLKVTQATPSITKTDPDYVARQKTLILELVELGMTGVSTSSISKIFDSLKIDVDGSYTTENIREIEKQIYAIVSKEDIQNAYTTIMSNPAKFKKFMAGPFGKLVTDKVKNLTVQINAKAPNGRTLRFFQTFINLQFSISDIVSKRDGDAYKFYLSSAFERKLIASTREKLLANAVGVINSRVDNALSFNLSGKTGLQQILQTTQNVEDLVNSLSFNQFEVGIPTGGSIPLNFGVDASNLLNTLNTRLPKILATNYNVAKTVQKGRFASAPQLTSLLRLEVYSRMKKAGKAAPPIMTNRSGRFIENLEVAQVNYRNNIINYYSLPLYYSLEKYDYEVTDLIEGSLRAVTQKLYSRQFNLVRA
jgi:hypothetical protein